MKLAPAVAKAKRKEAKRLFMVGEYQKDIAAVLEVSEKTIGTWVAEGNWTAYRDAVSMIEDTTILERFLLFFKSEYPNSYKEARAAFRKFMLNDNQK